MTSNTQLADALFRIIPQAIDLSTKRLQKGLSIISGGRFNDLDEYFGDNTVDKTKLLANIFNPALEDAAKQLGVDYITEETVGYDAILLEEEIENKLTLGSSTSSFATGNNHSKTKVDKIFVCKLVQTGNEFPEIFAAIVDLSLAQEDAICITPIYGKIRKTTKFIHTEYETLSK